MVYIVLKIKFNTSVRYIVHNILNHDWIHVESRLNIQHNSTQFNTIQHNSTQFNACWIYSTRDSQSHNCRQYETASVAISDLHAGLVSYARARRDNFAHFREDSIFSRVLPMSDIEFCVLGFRVLGGVGRDRRTAARPLWVPHAKSGALSSCYGARRASRSFSPTRRHSFELPSSKNDLQPRV